MTDFVSDAAQKRIFRYLASDRVHPAILISGGSAEERGMVAKSAAKFLLCESPKGINFCGSCRFCRLIDKDSLPDLFILNPEEDTIKIDEVREVCHQMELSPLEAKAKVAVISECHRMTGAAVNACLKSLEEPHKGRYFILTTSHPSELLPTLLSRCIEFRLAPLKEEAPRVSEAVVLSLKNKECAAILAEAKEREDAAKFVVYLQTEIRNVSGVFRDMNIYERLAQFENLLEIERRLRSSVNCGLLLEAYLREKLFPALP